MSGIKKRRSRMASAFLLYMEAPARVILMRRNFATSCEMTKSNPEGARESPVSS